MKRFLAITSFIALLGAPAFAKAATGMYMTIKKTVEVEFNKVETPDEKLTQFIARILSDERIEFTSEEIGKVLTSKNPYEVCSERDDETLVNCDMLLPRMQKMAANEMRVRALGHNLQIAASSFEVPISDLPGRATRLASDLRGLLSIWSAGTGSIKSSINTIPIRTKSDEDGSYDNLLKELGDLLKDLDEEERIAAIWRYQYGVRLIKDERAPRFPAPLDDQSSGPGTERQYIFKKWPKIEEKLSAIWDKAKADPFDPPLAAHEIGFITLNESIVDSALPENVILWIRVDSQAEHPFGDVGLQWKTPIEPVQPSLLKDGDEDTIILGGDYPPEPPIEDAEGTDEQKIPQGRGLCTSPSALRGYLCRPFEAIAPDERCPKEDDDEDTDKIRLTTCTNTGSIRTTAAGADVCREVNWLNKKPFDPNTQCTIEFNCSNSCIPGGNASAIAKAKEADGSIELCMNDDTWNKTYLGMHELVHAYQKCHQPPKYTPYDGLNAEQKGVACCHIEGEAYALQCAMMERDGVFGDPSTNPITFRGTNIPINAETCTEVLTDYDCKSEGYKGCYVSRSYPATALDEVWIAQYNNPKDVPYECDDTIDPEKMDQRMKDLIEAIEHQHHVCLPGNQSTYVNRIGNNACYIGTCVEQSVELHNISAGRTPTTVQDEIAPWHDPESGTPLGNLLMNPPDVQLHLPVYRPGYVAQQLDTALCQLQGLPPQTPPILCVALANRQLEGTRLMGIDVTKSLLMQRGEGELASTDLLNLGPAIGVRMGSTLYADYLRASSQSFASLLTVASKLLEDLTKIDFPKDMCPIEPGLPPPSPPSS